MLCAFPAQILGSWSFKGYWTLYHSKICQQFSRQQHLDILSAQLLYSRISRSTLLVSPFSGDISTGCKFTILVVTGWAEGAATQDASPETVSEFIYTYIVTRFGCPLSLQSDHRVQLVNPIIRAILQFTPNRW